MQSTLCLLLPQRLTPQDTGLYRYLQLLLLAVQYIRKGSTLPVQYTTRAAPYLHAVAWHAWEQVVEVVVLDSTRRPSPPPGH
jgi:hypothetical protein